MKILQICPYYAPAWAYGGPPRVMFSFAKGLVSRGHEVTVYTTDAYDENSRIGKSYDILEGVKIHYFRNVSNHLAYKKRFIPAGFRNFLKKHINDFDIVHISDTRAYLSLFAYLYSKKMEIPLNSRCGYAGNLRGDCGMVCVVHTGRTVRTPLL